MDALVKDYVSDLTNETENHQTSRLILAHRRKDVAKLNDSVRKALIAQDQLTNGRKYETANGTKTFATGERILFTQNDSTLGVKNGTLGTVLKTEANAITIQPDDHAAQPIIVDLETYNSLDHGYAVTIHKSQGATVDKTWAFLTKTMNQHLMYVAGTRHRVRCKFYTCHSTINKAKVSVEKYISTGFTKISSPRANRFTVYRLSKNYQLHQR